MSKIELLSHILTHTNKCPQCSLFFFGFVFKTPYNMYIIFGSLVGVVYRIFMWCTVFFFSVVGFVSHSHLHSLASFYHTSHYVIGEIWLKGHCQADFTIQCWMPTYSVLEQYLFCFKHCLFKYLYLILIRKHLQKYTKKKKLRFWNSRQWITSRITWAVARKMMTIHRHRHRSHTVSVCPESNDMERIN